MEDHEIYGKIKEKSPIPIRLQKWQISCQQVFCNDNQGKWPGSEQDWDQRE